MVLRQIVGPGYHKRVFPSIQLDHMADEFLFVFLSLAVPGAFVVVGLVFRGRDQLPATPEEFFDAASRSDDRAYLRLVDGELRRSLAAQRSQQGGTLFVTRSAAPRPVSRASPRCPTPTPRTGR